jgi:hypothetical protein
MEESHIAVAPKRTSEIRSENNVDCLFNYWNTVFQEFTLVSQTVNQAYYLVVLGM